MKIAIFHYHLHPGGVTTVIRYSAAAAAAYIDGIAEILLVAGDREHADSVGAAVSESVPDHRKCRIQSAVMPEIGYTDEKEAVDIDHQELKKRLLKRFGGYFWWIHNYHIGKNPLFTRAVVEIAEEQPGQPVLFHIHDFPECARYGNLYFLRKYHTETLYPANKNIFYSAINSRDYKLLTDAGLPASNVFYLPNPKPPEQTQELPPPPVQEKIDRAYEQIESYTAGAPVLLYPVRSIRRKNVLEAGLLSRLTDSPVNLFTTLPGRSVHEKGYSDLVGNAYQQKLIPGVFGAGTPSMEETAGITFHGLISISRCIISSSIQEGFGYLFLQSISWEKKLFAKNLETLSDFSPFFSENSHCVYSGLSVPLEKKEQDIVKKRYHEYLTSLITFFGEEGAENLASELDRILGRNPSDFSFLPPDMQYNILTHCRQETFRRECRSINKQVLDRFSRLLVSNQEIPKINLDGRFGFEAYARRVEEILTAAAPSASPPPQGLPAQPKTADGLETDRKIRQFFLKPEYLRLLYAPYPP